MGIVVGPAVWIGNAHPVHQLDRAPAGCASRQAPVGPEHLPDLVRDREHRVQGGERVLEDHRDFLAPHPAPLSGREFLQIPVAETYAIARDHSRR